MNSLSILGKKTLSQALLSACLAGGMLTYTGVAAAADGDQQQQQTQSDYQATSNSDQQQNRQQVQQQQEQQQGAAMDQQPNIEQRDAGIEQQDAGSADQAEAPDAVVSVVTITEIPLVDLEQLIDQDVINLAGETIGDVERIITNPDGTIAGLIVGSGGFLGMWETELFVPAEELQITANNLVWQTSLDQDTLEDAPQYQLEQYTAME